MRLIKPFKIEIVLAAIALMCVAVATVPGATGDRIIYATKPQLDAVQHRYSSYSAAHAGIAPGGGITAITSATPTTFNAGALMVSNGLTLRAGIPGTDYLMPNGDGSHLTGLTPGQVGLPLVLNIAQEPAFSPGNTAQYYRGDKTWRVLNTDVVPEGIYEKWDYKLTDVGSDGFGNWQLNFLMGQWVLVEASAVTGPLNAGVGDVNMMSYGVGTDYIWAKDQNATFKFTYYDWADYNNT